MTSEEVASNINELGGIYTATGTVGIIANIAQFVLVYRDKTSRETVFNMILQSLCIADLLLSGFLLYRGVIHLLHVFMVIDDSWLRDLFSRVNAAFAFYLTSAFLHVVFIAIVRVIAVLVPLKFKQIITRSRCKFSMIFLWTLSIGSAIVVGLTDGFEVLSYLAITTSFLLFITYSIICYRMCKKRSNISQGNEQMQINRRRSDRNVFLYSVALSVTFSVCFVPESLSLFIEFPPFLYLISSFLYAINPFLDTLLYFFHNYHKRRQENAALRQ